MRRGPFRLKAQILCGDAIAFGPGKADLLDAIEAAGSIAAAGRAMGLSYRRAWLLVDEMNRCWRAPLVETGNRGTRLTELGRRVRAAYRELDAAIAAQVAAAPAFAALSEALREAPLTD